MSASIGGDPAMIDMLVSDYKMDVKQKDQVCVRYFCR